MIETILKKSGIKNTPAHRIKAARLISEIVGKTGSTYEEMHHVVIYWMTDHTLRDQLISEFKRRWFIKT